MQLGRGIYLLLGTQHPLRRRSTLQELISKAAAPLGATLTDPAGRRLTALGSKSSSAEGDMPGWTPH